MLERRFYANNLSVPRSVSNLEPLFQNFSRYKTLPVFPLYYRNGTLEYLNQWLARVYELTTKFYTIKKCSSQMGTFTFYAAIDVNLDESKDDVHVVINSDNLYRPDIIFRFIDDCFQERKVRDFDFSIRNCVGVTQPINRINLLLLLVQVVALLHIVTNDEQRLREDPSRLETIIRTMVEPIVVHL